MSNTKVSEITVLSKIAYALFGISLVSVITLISIVWIFRDEWKLWGNELHNWGDFLAGLFGFPSLIILAAAFLLQASELQIQRKELRQTREALLQQAKELENAAHEAKLQNNILSNQYVLAEWQNTSARLYSLSVLIFRNIYRLISYNESFDFRGKTFSQPPEAIAEFPRDSFISEFIFMLETSTPVPARISSPEFANPLRRGLKAIDAYVVELNTFLYEVDSAQSLKATFRQAPEALLGQKLTDWAAKVRMELSDR